MKLVDVTNHSVLIVPLFPSQFIWRLVCPLWFLFDERSSLWKHSLTSDLEMISCHRSPPSIYSGQHSSLFPHRTDIILLFVLSLQHGRCRWRRDFTVERDFLAAMWTWTLVRVATDYFIHHYFVSTKPLSRRLLLPHSPVPNSSEIFREKKEYYENNGTFPQAAA